MEVIETQAPLSWTEYKLIDCGNFEKLEQFGQYVIARPEPQALWDKSMSDAQWEQMADALFVRDKNSPDKGMWHRKKHMPDRWKINYQYKSTQLSIRLAMTAFKHVGLFPEQAANWNFIYDFLTSDIHFKLPKVLNLFAYTGVASLIAKAAGADVVHVDSVKPVLTWGNENMVESGLSDIRWVHEDAFKFVQREAKRGKKYQMIILDPPAYGRGPTGEKWLLEEQLNQLLHLCKEILYPENACLILNLYAMGFSSLVAQTLLKRIFGQDARISMGELYVKDDFEKILPLGIYARLVI